MNFAINALLPASQSRSNKATVKLGKNFTKATRFDKETLLVESGREVSTPIVVLIVVFAVTAGIALGILIDYLGPVRKEEKEEAKKRVEVLRKVWSFLADNFYEPIVFEVAKEVAETGILYGPNYKKWGDALRVLEELGFTKDRRVRDRMSIIHSAKATKFMINIGWPDGIDMPYIGTRTWSILYLDEKKNQIVRLFSKCQADALSVFPLHQLLKAKEIQIHNPKGDLTDYLTVEQTENEVVVSRLDGTEVGHYEKPKEEAAVETAP